MPAPTKRTRSTTVDEENLPPTPSSSSRPSTRRSLQADTLPAPSLLAPAPATTTPTTPARPIQTRSSAQPGSTPLSRASSLFTPSTRRANTAYPLPLPTPPPSGPSSSPLTRPGLGSGGVGTLLRTQSSPAITRHADLKDAVAGGAPGPSRGKGDPEDVFAGGPGRKWGKGKENIPPKKDSEREEENIRKRLRVGGSRGAGSAGGRGRSGSVVSVRSESSSGPSLFSRRSTAFPSPSPSPSTATSHSADSASSVDPLDVLDEDDDAGMDLDKTPTKARPHPRRRVTLPTPPPSSPAFTAQLENAGKRMGMVRVDSTSSIASISLSRTGTTTDAGTETETEDTETDVVEALPTSKFRNAYKHLKSFLRLSNTTAKSTSAEIVGREEEKAVLRSYFSLRSSSDVGLYVSGPPGTGKTALVTALGREMVREGWRIVEVGCMGVKTGDVWARLGEQLGCTATEEGVREAIVLAQNNVVIILDEIDSLLPKAPAQPTPATSHLLSRLFSLALLSSDTSIVKLIAISNTLDLTVRARLVLPGGAQPQVLPFKAYGASDMVGIISSRITASAEGHADDKTAKVDAKAIELLARKVEAQNGDLRMCLASLSSAVNLAETEWVKKTFTVESDSGSATVPLIKVSLPHVIKAFNSHTQQLKAAAGSAPATGPSAGSPTTRKIRSVPLQGKMVLVSILIYLSRVQVGLPGCPTAGSASSSPTNSPHKHGDLTTSSLYATYSAILSHATSPFPPAAESDYRDLLSNLEVLGLVSLLGGAGSSGMSRTGTGSSSTSAGRGKSSNGQGQRVELCVRIDEIKAGLGILMDLAAKSGAPAATKGMADEEVGRVWEREEAKVVKAREKVARAAEALAVAGKEI